MLVTAFFVPAHLPEEQVWTPGLLGNRHSGVRGECRRDELFFSGEML